MFILPRYYKQLLLYVASNALSLLRANVVLVNVFNLNDHYKYPHLKRPFKSSFQNLIAALWSRSKGNYNAEWSNLARNSHQSSVASPRVSEVSPAEEEDEEFESSVCDGVGSDSTSSMVVSELAQSVAQRIEDLSTDFLSSIKLEAGHFNEANEKHL